MHTDQAASLPIVESSPMYFVRHVDGIYSPALPQPTLSTRTQSLDRLLAVIFDLTTQQIDHFVQMAERLVREHRAGQSDAPLEEAWHVQIGRDEQVVLRRYSPGGLVPDEVHAPRSKPLAVAALASILAGYQPSRNPQHLDPRFEQTRSAPSDRPAA